MTDMTVSRTILSQLGGNRFLAMTGAKGLVGSNDALSFRLPTRAGKPNAVRIVLANDLYDITMSRVTGTKVKTLSSISGVGVENLRECIEDGTGLALSL